MGSRAGGEFNGAIPRLKAEVSVKHKERHHPASGQSPAQALIVTCKKKHHRLVCGHRGGIEPHRSGMFAALGHTFVRSVFHLACVTVHCAMDARINHALVKNPDCCAIVFRSTKPYPGNFHRESVRLLTVAVVYN